MSRLYRIISNITDRIAGTKTANTIFAAPNSTDGAPTFRQIVKADLPNDIVDVKVFTSSSAVNINAGTTSSAISIDISYGQNVPLIVLAQATGPTGSLASHCCVTSGSLSGKTYRCFVKNTGTNQATNVSVQATVLFKSGYLRP